jgi:hypothetical protein
MEMKIVYVDVRALTNGNFGGVASPLGEFRAKTKQLLVSFLL